MSMGLDVIIGPVSFATVRAKENVMKSLTLKEACEILQISRTQLYYLMKQGKIRCVKIGKRGKRIPHSELERFQVESLEDL